MIRSRKAWSRIGRAAVSVALLTWVFDSVDWQEVQQLLLSGRTELLLIVLLLFFANTTISALKWQLLLRADGIHTPYFQLLRTYLVGTFLNFFLPSNIGGDGYRVIDVGQRSGRPVGTLASVLAERLSGLVALVILGAAFGLVGFRLLPEWQLLLLPLAAMISLAVVIVLLFHQRLLRAIVAGTALRRIPQVAGFVTKLLNSVTQYRRTKGLVVPVLVLSFVFQINVILSIFVLSRSLNLNIPLFYFCVFVPFISLVEVIPITIHGLGLREASYALLLVPLGYRRGAVLGLALAYLIVTIIYSLVGGAILLWRTMRPAALRSATDGWSPPPERSAGGQPKPPTNEPGAALSPSPQSR